MTQKDKSYIFTDFDCSTKNLSDSKLLIRNHYNVSNRHGISTINGFTDILSKFYTESEIEEFKNKNSEVLNTIIYYFVYEVEGTTPTKRIFAVSANFNLYELNVSAKSFTNLNVRFATMPKFYVFDKILYITSPNGMLYYLNGSGNLTSKNARLNIDHVFWFNRRYYFTTHEDKYKISSSVYDYFADIYEDTVTFTDFNLENKFGKVVGIQSMNSSVYVFQQYKISSINITSTSKHVRGEVTLTSPIIENSILKIGDYVVFMTTDGIYKFNGNSVSKIFEDIDYYDYVSTVQAASLNQKYYFKIDAADGGSYLYELDLEGDRYEKYKLKNLKSIFSIISPSCNFFAICEENSGIFSTKCMSICEKEKNEQLIQFVPLFFEDLKIKSLNGIKILCTGKFKLKIKTDFSKLEIEVNGNFERSNLGLFGKVFELEIFSNEAFEISLINLNVTSYSE